MSFDITQCESAIIALIQSANSVAWRSQCMQRLTANEATAATKVAA
jgi:hypothetical protein